MYSKIIKALIMGIFLLSNITWAAQVQVAYQIELCMGKNGYRSFSGTAPWKYVSAGQSHTSSDAVDIEENGGTGDYGYLYMAYRTIVMYNYIDTQGYDERPITDIIIVDFGSSSEILNVYYANGRMYHRVPITSQDGKTNYPLNRDKFTDSHHYHLYYTRDYIDGKAITEIRASKTKTSGYSIDGFETVKNQNGAYANINANPKNSYLNYLHIKREEMPNRAEYTKEPFVKSSVTYSPFGVSLGDALYYGAYSGSYYTQTHKIGDKYEDGKWNLRDNVYLEPGNHDVYTKLDPGIYDPIYVTGPHTITVDKISGTEHYNKYFKLKTPIIYSGEKIDIEWRNPCVDADHYTGYAPSDAKYLYTPVNNISYTEINPSTFIFNHSGIYYLEVKKNENNYCKLFDKVFQIEVLKSKLIIKKKNGEADVVIEKDVDEPINYTLPTSLTWTGHTFKGWSRSVPATMPAGITTIEAQWTTNSYTLTVNPNASSDNVYKNKASNCADEGYTSCYSNLFTKTTQLVPYEASLSSYKPSTLYRIGYTFNGWSSSETTMPAKNLTLTAQWKINKYTWTFDTDGGSTIAPITKNYRESVTKPSNPTKDGYDFIGWDKEIPSTMTVGNKTFKAQWKARTYYIRFENGYTNEVIKSVLKECDSDITDVTYPKNPTRTGYTFTGWDVPTLPSTMPANNIVVTAKWNINKYQVTFPSKYMEAITPQGFTGGKLDYNTSLKLKFKDEYKYLGTVSKNGTQFTDQSGIYTISYIAENVDIEIDAEKIYENYGSVLVKIDHSEAIIGYDSPETREIAKPIEVDSITYAKSFTKNVTESIMFPFEMDLRYIHGGIFCKFTGYDKEQSVMRMLFMRTKLAANTPYLIVPTSKNLTFNLSKGQKVAIQTSDNHSVREGDWEFRGTYDFTNWANLTDEVGKAYIFKANGEGDGIKGQFNKVTEKNTLEPLRAYLIYNPIQQVKRSEAAFVAPSPINTFNLPEVIDVRIESENGGTTAIGQFNTRTGEFKINRWFDLNGKLLKEKPTTNGIYYNNGKKVIVK